LRAVVRHSIGKINFFFFLVVVRESLTAASRTIQYMTNELNEVRKKKVREREREKKRKKEN
jgi:hypothetical protein